MIEAFILLTLEGDKVETAIKTIRKKIPEVKEAKGVTGPYDAILRVDAKDLTFSAGSPLPKGRR